MKKIAVILFLLFITLPLFSYTLEEGNLRLVVDEENGGFLLYQRADRQSPWVSLMEESFLGTFFSVSYNGEWINLMLDPEMNRRIESDGVTLTIIFEERRFKALVTMDLIQFGDTSLQNALRCSGEVISKETQSSRVAVRFVFDSRFTRDGEHYFIQGQSYDSETAFSGLLPPYILNRSESSYEDVYLVFQDQNHNPGNVFLGNWNRIDRDGNDLYRYEEGRKFDDLPFSVNDSAVAMYWNEDSLSYGQSYPFSVLISVDEPMEIESVPVVVDEIESPADRELRVQLIREHLMYIQEYLDELTYIEQSGQTLSENDMFELREKLEILRDKKSDYEGVQ